TRATRRATSKAYSIRSASAGLRSLRSSLANRSSVNSSQFTTRPLSRAERSPRAKKGQHRPQRVWISGRDDGVAAHEVRTPSPRPRATRSKKAGARGVRLALPHPPAPELHRFSHAERRRGFTTPPYRVASDASADAEDRADYGGVGTGPSTTRSGSFHP